jgi:uncharacterized membrane protein
MYISLNMLEPLLAVVAGIVVMVQPKLTPYVVGVYLIVIGVLGLLPYI